MNRFQEAIILCCCVNLLSSCGIRNSPENSDDYPPAPKVLSHQALTENELSFDFLKWEEGLCLLIAHNARKSYSIGSNGPKHDPTIVTFFGSASDFNGGEFQWRIETKDGLEGVFLLANQKYHLGKGKLFVIETRRKKVRILQLNHALSEIPFNQDDCHKYLMHDEEVSNFLSSVK